MIREIKKIFTALDDYMFYHVHPYVNDMNTNIMVFITFLASQQFLLPAYILLALYFILIEKDKWATLKIAVVSLGGVAIVGELKHYFRRVRPVHPVHDAALGYSFPSGHAFSATTFYGLIIYLCVSRIKDSRTRWALAAFFSALILAIGFSRIYLRVHYASDVLGGFAIGYLWLMVSLWILNTIEKKSGHDTI